MLEPDPTNARVAEVREKQLHDVGGEAEVQTKGAEEVEGQRHAAEQIPVKPMLVDESADLAIGDLAPSHGGDGWREEVSAGLGRGRGDAGAELPTSSALGAVSADG